jgi:hypothetical protein
MPAQRSVPPARYPDVLGQNIAVEAALDLIELPLKRADPSATALLARAVAGECGVHIEVVNGPAVLSELGGPSRSGRWLLCVGLAGLDVLQGGGDGPHGT